MSHQRQVSRDSREGTRKKWGREEHLCLRSAGYGHRRQAEEDSAAEHGRPPIHPLATAHQQCAGSLLPVSFCFDPASKHFFKRKNERTGATWRRFPCRIFASNTTSSSHCQQPPSIWRDARLARTALAHNYRRDAEVTEIEVFETVIVAHHAAYTMVIR